MQRVDHVLYQADTDFIAYMNAQNLPGNDMGHEPCGSFAFFLAHKIKSGQSTEAAFQAIERIIRGGGWNAEQLRLSFFPTLSRVLGATHFADKAESSMGPLSQGIWRLNLVVEPTQII